MATALTYTATLTVTILALMRDRGLSVTALATNSGVPRRTLDACLYDGKDWKTSHLEAIAAALNTDLAAMVSPSLRATA